MNAGDTVYTTDGRETVLVSVEPDGYVVREIIDGDDESELGRPRLERTVHTKPPTVRYTERVAEAQTALSAAKLELATINRDVIAAKAERDSQIKALAAHPSLTPVIEFIEGRLTHVATVSFYGPIKIQPIGEAVTPGGADEKRKGKIRLLALYGGYTGPEKRASSYPVDDLRWQLNTYSDGSGDSAIAILGTSEECVKERLQKWLNAEFKKRDWHYRNETGAAALKLGLTVPDDVAAEVRKRAEAQAIQAAVQARKTLDNAKAAVLRAEADFAKATGAQP